MEQDRKETNGNMAAIILAGGYSSRMGAFKPLLKIGDLPAVDVLVRSFVSAGIIAGEAAGSYAIVPKDGFSEIALGEWEGKFISEIKEKYPEQFRARGENKFQFKMGNDSEIFYDLQYRVLTTLKEILKNDHSRDIVIVSHRGVIRTIENNLAIDPL